MLTHEHPRCTRQRPPGGLHLLKGSLTVLPLSPAFVSVDDGVQTLSFVQIREMGQKAVRALAAAARRRWLGFFLRGFMWFMARHRAAQRRQISLLRL
jgi:hypothetical protein